MYKFEVLLIFIITNLFFIINFNNIKLFQIVLDKPDNKRKFHKKTIPLAGGIILIINIILYQFLGFFFYNQLQNEFYLNLFFITCLLIFLLGLIDDKCDLKPLVKFFFLTLIIGMFIYFDPSTKIETLKLSFLDIKIFLNKYSYIFTLFCFLVFLNCFNMFDGINLQSSSYSLIIFTYFLFITQFSIFVCVIIIFLIFFIYLNYNNKTFFGDNGSLLISFIISYIFINLFNTNLILYSDTVLIFMLIPGIDMIRLFFERIKNKKNPLAFDRSHLHHLLIKKYSLLKTNILINLLIISPLILNFFSFDKIIIISLTILIYSLIIIHLKKIE